MNKSRLTARTNQAAVNTVQFARDQITKSLASWTATVTAPMLQQYTSLFYSTEPQQ